MQKEVLGKTSLGNTFKENREQLLQSGELANFDETQYRVIKLTTFDGLEYRVLTIVAGVGTYSICEFLGKLGGNVNQYTIGNSALFSNVDVDVGIIKKFYAEKWFSKGYQIIDFFHESTFVDVDIILIDDGLEQKINEIWSHHCLSISRREDKAVIYNSIACLEYGTYRILGEAGVSYEKSAPHQWLQRAVILYKKYYSKVAQTYSVGSAPFGAHVPQNVHLYTMTSIDIGVYINDNTVVENYVMIHTGVQIGKNCHIGAGSIIGSANIKPGELPTVVKDNSIIGAHVVIGSGIVFPEYVRIGTGVCLEDNKSIVFDRVLGHAIKCKDLAPGSVVVVGTINPHTKLMCPCVISYDGLPED